MEKYEYPYFNLLSFLNRELVGLWDHRTLCIAFGFQFKRLNQVADFYEIWCERYAIRAHFSSMIF